MKVKSQSVKTYLIFDIQSCRAGFGQWNSTVGGTTQSQCDAAEIQYKPREKQNVLQLIVASQNKTFKLRVKKTEFLGYQCSPSHLDTVLAMPFLLISAESSAVWRLRKIGHHLSLGREQEVAPQSPKHTIGSQDSTYIHLIRK